MKWMAAGFALTLMVLLSSCLSEPSPSAPPLPGDSACLMTYLALFARPALEVRVAFGYKDTAPARFVADRYERAVFVDWVLKPCGPGEYACGFARSAADADLFTKKMQGPDGHPHDINLRVLHSAVGPDDRENRLNPFQKWQSDYARTQFLAGVESADVVFYNGHSRDGGGPDFEPARLNAESHVDYAWYKGNKRGLEEMLGVLKKRKQGPNLIGLFSCSSDLHFSRRLRSGRAGLGLIASQKLLYFSDALESTHAALSAVLGMKCRPDFERTLKARSGQDGTQLSGFFESEAD